MSSEQEGTDHLDEPNMPSDSNIEQVENQQGNGLREHAKPRRRRRGKKRKQRKESAATCEVENPEECENEMHAESEHDNPGENSPEWGSDDSLSCNYDTYTDVIIRPVNVPMAPLNSTQFIMDDHDDCRFYMSFETPNPYGESESQLHKDDGDIIEPIGEDAAYIDIDYQYESPQDFDNSAYYDKEFELSYKNNRFEELMRLTRNDLINRLQALESHLKELSENLVKENPSPILEQLQAELLELQEKNSYLKECNAKLKSALLQNESDCSETVKCSLLDEDISVSHEHESEGSYSDVDEKCRESVDEVIMSDVNVINEVRDKNCDQFCKYEIYGQSHSDFSEELSNLQNNHSEDSNQLADCLENTNLSQAVHSDEDVQKHEEEGELKLSPNNLETEECVSSNNVLHSEGKKSQLFHSNSHIMHCQASNLINNDLRTLNINTTELYRISNKTKCSSSVPREGGMSPSETSVN